MAASSTRRWNFLRPMGMEFLPRVRTMRSRIVPSRFTNSLS
jgi:hypothetical protein